MICFCMVLCVAVPTLTWYYAPAVLLISVNECRTQTINIIQDNGKTLIVHGKWWLRPGVTRATGTYSARTEIQTTDGVTARNYVSKAFLMEYQIVKRNLDIRMINVSHLDGGNNTSAVENRFIDPLIHEGLRMSVHFFRLPGGAIMSGLSDRPRSLCE